MKYLIPLLFTVTLLCAEGESWEFERFSFYFENDADIGTDRGYTDGSRLGLLMYRPDTADSWLKIPYTELPREHFISFSLNQQIFTPESLEAKELIEDDRPYAGWLYFQTALYQSSEEHLDMLAFQIGIVGDASQMEAVQKYIHSSIGSPPPEGWDNQLENELGVQLNYQHKWRFVPQPVWGVESTIIPYVGGEFGNVAIKGNVGAEMRLGWNIPADFGAACINGGGMNGVPVQGQQNISERSPWSFYANLSTGGSVVLRDIFLDGNTFEESHSVDKNYLVGYWGYGLSVRYRDFSLDYLRTHHSLEYKTQRDYDSFGTLIFSWYFSP